MSKRNTRLFFTQKMLMPKESKLESFLINVTDNTLKMKSPLMSSLLSDSTG
jgi:hypothetical protein